MTTFKFNLKFVCPSCKQEARLVQASRYWNLVDSFSSDEAGVACGDAYKPQLIQFSCASCKSIVCDENGDAVTGRKNMYNWLFDNKMLLYNGNVMDSTAYRFDAGEPPWKRDIIETEVPDEQCDPSLLP